MQLTWQRTPSLDKRSHTHVHARVNLNDNEILYTHSCERNKRALDSTCMILLKYTTQEHWTHSALMSITKWRMTGWPKQPRQTELTLQTFNVGRPARTAQHKILLRSLNSVYLQIRFAIRKQRYHLISLQLLLTFLAHPYKHFVIDPRDACTNASVLQCRPTLTEMGKRRTVEKSCGIRQTSDCSECYFRTDGQTDRYWWRWQTHLRKQPLSLSLPLSAHTRKRGTKYVTQTIKILKIYELKFMWEIKKGNWSKRKECGKGKGGQSTNVLRVM
jgi:hypothetical protein